MKNPIPFLRTVARLEGYSFLLLLGVAMPLKYMAGMPMAVRIVGGIHGLLFLTFCVALLQTKLIAQWPLGRSAALFVASLLPFGPMIMDRRMAAYEQEFTKNN